MDDETRRSEAAEILRASGLPPAETAQRLRDLRIERPLAVQVAHDTTSQSEFWSHLENISQVRDEDALSSRLRCLLDSSGPVSLGSLWGDRLRALARHQALQEAIDSWRGESLLLLGPTGCGKTATAVALSRMALARRTRLTWFAGSALLLSQRRHPLGQGEPPEYERAVMAELLVVDDPDWIRSRDADELFSLVCAERERHQRPLIVTSGATRSEFVERYGAAVVRRIVESSRDENGRGTGKVVECH